MADNLITVKAGVDSGRVILSTKGTEHITEENPTGEVFIKGDGGETEHVVAPTAEVARLIRSGHLEVVDGDIDTDVTDDEERALAENAEAKQTTTHPSLVAAPKAAPKADGADAKSEPASSDEDARPTAGAASNEKPSEAPKPAEAPKPTPAPAPKNAPKS